MNRRLQEEACTLLQTAQFQQGCFKARAAWLPAWQNLSIHGQIILCWLKEKVSIAEMPNQTPHRSDAIHNLQDQISLQRICSGAAKLTYHAVQRAQRIIRMPLNYSHCCNTQKEHCQQRWANHRPRPDPHFLHGSIQRVVKGPILKEVQTTDCTGFRGFRELLVVECLLVILYVALSESSKGHIEYLQVLFKSLDTSTITVAWPLPNLTD